MIDDDTLGNLDGDVFTPGMYVRFFETCYFLDGIGFGNRTEEIDLASINL